MVNKIKEKLDATNACRRKSDHSKVDQVTLKRALEIYYIQLYIVGEITGLNNRIKRTNLYNYLRKRKES